MGALLTDLYQLTMLQAYLDEGMEEDATFELFVRKLPPGRNFLVAAGLEPALAFLEALAFGDDELAWLDGLGGFSQRLLDYLKGWRFRGEVHAMAEGTVFFADEPILRVTAPLPQAQLIESGAPIDGFGIGTAMDTSGDAPSLDAVYKLQSYAGVARRKRSPGKATWPGIKQVVRFRDVDGRLAFDRVQLQEETAGGEALLQPCLRSGGRVGPTPTLEQSRSHCAAELRGLPGRLRGLHDAEPGYRVEVSAAIRELTRRVDRASGREAALPGG